MGNSMTSFPSYNDESVADIQRLILCTGKVYYDLLEKHSKHNLQNVGIIRVEQLYPFPKDSIQSELAKFKHLSEILWVQEEPKNQGAWFYMQSDKHLPDCMSTHQSLKYVGRDYSASPAVGYLQLHKEQQNKLVNEALDLSDMDNDRALKIVK